MAAITVLQAFALALQHHQAGRLPEARALYLQVLAVQPNHAGALHRLGIIAHREGDSALAVEMIKKAISLHPQDPVAHFDLGGVYSSADRLVEAIAEYRRAVELKPDYAEACNDLGGVLARRGQFDNAAVAFRRAVELQPRFAMAQVNLGHALSAQGRVDEAIAAWGRVLEINPGYPGVHELLGDALQNSGRWDEAAVLWRRALEIKPGSAKVHNNLGNALKDLGRFGEAIVEYRRALDLQPDLWETLNNLGDALRSKERWEEAAACYQRALALNPRFPDARLNLGVVRWAEAKFSEAEGHFREAMECRADFAEAHLNLGILLLLLGRYEEGWREYEWRWRSPDHAHRLRHFSVSEWDGQPVPGRTILVHAEQGFGDTLQFVRYLPLVRACSDGARVILECQPALVPLLRQMQGPGLEIVARGTADEALPPFDLHLPLFSIPLRLRRFEPLPIDAPYLQADAAIRGPWRERLDVGPELRVGVAWAGDPAHGHDHRRSIAPEKLAAILSVPDVRFVSLRIEPGEPLPASLAAVGVLDWTAEITDFSQSAALVAELDLIITVDTATAHLAGALGSPVWLLLPFVPDWRWGLGREDTPWYPTVRLFRQSAPGDWEEVIERVSAALRERCAARPVASPTNEIPR